MALDPNIALQFNNATLANSPMAGVTAGINNVNTMQNTAMSQAQQPGVEANSAMLQRQNLGQKWLQDNSDRYQITNENGSKSFDSARAASDLANAGYPEMASQLAAHYLNNEVLKTSAASGRMEMVNKLGDAVASIAGTMPDGPARDAAIEKYTGAMDGAGYVPGTGIKMGQNVAQQFWAKDAHGQPIMNPDGSHVLDDLAVNGRRMSTIPVDTQESIRQDQLADHTGADSMDATKPISKTTNALAVKLGLAKEGDAPQSDWYWHNRPDFQAALKNNAPSQSFVEEQKKAILNHGSNSLVLGSAIDAANEAGLPASWSPGVALSNWLAGKENKPGYGKFISMLQAAKQIDPTIDETKQDGPTILSKLQALQARSDKLTKYYGGASLTGPSPTDVSGLPQSGSGSTITGAAATPRVQAVTPLVPADASQAPGAANALGVPSQNQAGGQGMTAPKPQGVPQVNNSGGVANHAGKTVTEQEISALMQKFKVGRAAVLAKLKGAGVNVPAQ